jgi:hypothetical protein
MRTTVRRALVTGGAATAGAGIALLFTSGAGARIVDVYVLVVAAILMLAMYRTARAIARTRPSTFDRAVAQLRSRFPDEQVEVREERDVVLSRVNALHYHVRVRPVLREFADLRLRSRYGVDLDREPGRARDLVASRAWDIVRPDRDPPADRLGRGPSFEEQRAVMDELERLDA